jgi:hypothetical protein
VARKTLVSTSLSELSGVASTSLAGGRVNLVECGRAGGGPPFQPCFTLGIAETRGETHRRSMPCKTKEHKRRQLSGIT